MKRALPAPLALLGALALAGCSFSFSVGEGGVDMDEVAEEARVQLSAVSAQHGGAPFPKVTCPGDLDEEVGATTTCYASFDGDRHEIRVEVTAVDGDRVDLDFEADALPTEVGDGQPRT